MAEFGFGTHNLGRSQSGRNARVLRTSWGRTGRRTQSPKLKKEAQEQNLKGDDAPAGRF
jgi:hypothetical protein